MNSGDTGSDDRSSIEALTRETLPPDGSDWGRLHAMTDEEVRAAALSDPDAPPLTTAELARMRPVSQAKRVRQHLGMSQEDFAVALRIPVATLQAWERHEQEPDAGAKALSLAIERDPAAMRHHLLAHDAA